MINYKGLEALLKSICFKDLNSYNYLMRAGNVR